MANLPQSLTTDINQIFNCDIYTPLDSKAAKIEASRCYFCHDAPCIAACPTEINIPSFIHKISTDNLKGSAIDIFKENIFGGTCARVCPVEVLCEGACVRNNVDTPVEIGRLQRFATDQFFNSKQKHPFKRKSNKQKNIAVVGAGPAGLTCAHELAKEGYNVVIFEAKKKPGGLNEYGIAPYKMTNNFAQKEVDFILEIGGIQIKYERALGIHFTIDNLKRNYDAIFLAFGLAGLNALNLPGENIAGSIHALDFINALRESKDLSDISIGQDVIVIGGGSTAIDAGIESKMLGARSVTIVYRGPEENMKATWKEVELARKNGVQVLTGAKPIKILGSAQGIYRIEFERIAGISTEKYFTLKADTLFKAIGQHLIVYTEKIALTNNKIQVDEDTLATSIPGVFAGGDCIFGMDLTVNAVSQGKKGARAIHSYLEGRQPNG